MAAAHDLAGGAGSAARPHPLLVTADPGLSDELSRLAAAAGVVPHVVAHPREALPAWPRAPLVLVGADQADALAGLAPPRRDGVRVVAWEPAADHLFRVAVALGAEEVVGLPVSGSWLVELLTDSAEPRAGRGLVVGLLGGAGGAGATTTACALATVAAQAGPVALVDLDPRGPGVDRVLGGLDEAGGVGWEALHETTGRLSARALAGALPRARGVGVLTWDAGPPGVVQPSAARQALSAAARGHDLVVVDLPRAGGPVVEEVVARCDRLLVVCLPTVAGVASALRTCAGVPEGVALELLVRGRGDAGTVARVVRRPVLGCLPEQRGLEESVELGLGPVRSGRGPLARALRGVLDRLRAAEGRVSAA